MKFLFQGPLIYTEGNTTQGLTINTPREIPHKVQAAQLINGNPATGPKNTVQRRKLYYILLPTVYYYKLYSIHIFTSQVSNTTRDGRIQGERRRNSASSFCKALTRLNFFDFQIFENLSFNNFSIVIENSPESNGYIFLSMTQKFWRFLTLNQSSPSIWAQRDPTPIKFKNFSILSTQRTYWIIRTIRRHFRDVENA